MGDPSDDAHDGTQIDTEIAELRARLRRLEERRRVTAGELEQANAALLARHEVVASVQPAAAETARLSGVRVLLVDDTEDSLDMMKLTLELEGASVFAALSAAEAFEILERETVDVLVTDLGMPTTDGYGLLRSVRKKHPDHNGFVPAVALTGFASAEDRARTAAAGFSAHFAKPVDGDELIRTLARLAAS